MEAVRAGTRDDLERVVALAQAAAAELATERGGALFLRREGRRAGLRAELEAALDRADVRFAVGTLDGHVVGFGVVELQPLDGETLGVIRELYVEPGAREVGVGEALAADLLGFCARRGCSGVDAYALPGSRATKNFFEAHGFTARLLVLHRSLSP